MALGGGNFLLQNKILPGAYINFVSATRGNTALSDRGYGALALELDWGNDDEVFEVTNEDFQKNSLKLFGYDYGNEKLKGLRDLFLNLKTLYCYRLNKGNKASNTYATAKFSGTRGNDLKVVIKENVDEGSKKDVYLYLDNVLLDFQTVTQSSELKNNDYVEWKSSELTTTTGLNLQSGSNGSVTTKQHQDFLNKIESFTFNVLGTVSEDSAIKKLYIAFSKRMRDEVGAKFQTVVFNEAGDYEGVINLKNNKDLVYWVIGAEASCEINRSLTNRKYDGEFTIANDLTQNQLKECIKNGEFVFHKVGKDYRVLSDINSLVTVTDTKGEIFKDNQTIRVVDQIATDIANIFNTRYLGIVPNDKSGRISLWSDIVKHHEQLQKLRAIENFKEDDIVVKEGENKKSVLVENKITVIHSMAQLYMVVNVG